MDSLTQFGEGVQAVVFPQGAQSQYADNFAQCQPQMQRLPGSGGVMDAYGRDVAPPVLGVIDVALWLTGATAADVQQGVTTLRGMAAMGSAPLFKTRQDGVAVWTWARLERVEAPQMTQTMPQLRQRVRVRFLCASARWFGVGDAAFLDDPALLLDNSLTLGGGAANTIDQQTVTAGDTVTVTNAGNATTAAYLRWQANANGDPFSDPTVTRLTAAGQLADQITITGTIGGTARIDVDARTYRSNAYDRLRTASGAWLHLPPGSHTLTIGGTFSSNARLTIAWFDAWA